MSTNVLEEATSRARARLGATYRKLVPAEKSELSFGGQLLRPILMLAGASHTDDGRLWYAALAVQLAHEASLVHDDIIDDAVIRRGSPTVCAEKGVAAAVLRGDMLLTEAYAAAAQTGSVAFISHFATAVVRTVAAERQQGKLIGERVDLTTYQAIAFGKAGELMGCALAAFRLVADPAEASDHAALGRELGLLYQMIDDFLDYCPLANTGKPALGDYQQRRWTWPLDEIPNAVMGLPAPKILAALHDWETGQRDSSAFDRSVRRLRALIEFILRRSSALLPDDTLVPAILRQWGSIVDAAAEREREGRRTLARAAIVQRCASISAVRGGEAGYLARNGRSFHFASMLLQRGDARRIARVYAFCRFTDDLADAATDGSSTRRELLDEWLTIAENSYAGQPSGVNSLDVTMTEMRDAGVPFELARELYRGMLMDLGTMRYATLDKLRVYTHRVAGVVGLWIAQLSGVSDLQVLEHAERMGSAMQLTNILRDVGEDWHMGRLYLPLDVLARYGLCESDVGAMVAGTRTVCESYKAALRELLGVAHTDYLAAFAWLPHLPSPLQPCMAVAARLYEAIGAKVVRNGYDNINTRATTSRVQKVGIAFDALRALRNAQSGSNVHPVNSPALGAA